MCEEDPLPRRTPPQSETDRHERGLSWSGRIPIEPCTDLELIQRVRDGLCQLPTQADTEHDS